MQGDGGPRPTLHRTKNIGWASANLRNLIAFGLAALLTSVGGFAEEARGSELTAAGKPALAVELQADLSAPGLPFDGGASAQWPTGTSLGQILASGGYWDQLTLNGPLRARFEGTLEAQQFNLLAGVSGLGYEQLQLQGIGSLAGNELELELLELADVLDHLPHRLTLAHEASQSPPLSFPLRQDRQSFVSFLHGAFVAQIDGRNVCPPVLTDRFAAVL